MKRGRSDIPRWNELISLVFAIFLVLFIAILAYSAWVGYGRVSQQLEITRRVVIETDALLASVTDAETGQRGFLLTGEDRYLEPYRRAELRIPIIFNNLNAIPASPQGAGVDDWIQLRSLVTEKLAELQHTIELRRTSGLDAALAVVLTDHGKVIMDQIRRVCAETQTRENDRLLRFSQESQNRAKQLGLISTIGSAALLVLLVFSTSTIHAATRRRQDLIARLKESEQRVTESRNWLQTTLASIGDAVIATDPGGKVNFLNGVAQTMTGWTQQEAAGKPLEEIFVIRNEDTGAVVENPVSKALREGRVVGLANHTKLISKSGREVPVDDSAAPIRDATGEVFGVVLVFRDVTDRKEAERAVQRSVQHFRLMADNAPVLIWICGADKLMIWFNKPWLDFVGRGMEQEIGDRWRENVHPADLDQWVETFDAAFEARRAFAMELRLRRHDLRYRWILCNGIPLYGASGEFTGYIGSCFDITERKEAEEQLRRANEDLNQFAFAASHDLQEPLRMITSYSELLVKGYNDGRQDEAPMCVAFITEGTNRMRDLLSDLLAYTQLSADGVPVEVVDLNLALQKSLDNLKAAIEETNAVVTSDRLPVVRGQLMHFIQLFQNLTENAIKYRGDHPPAVHVSASRHDAGWRLSVADNGIGIERAYQQKIFGVFKRLHGRTIPGTGIGLAICQRVVERYGGRIWVESEANRGATFYFTLPAADGDRR